MSLSSIDKSRALRTEDELHDLVEAIYNSPPGAQETNWLEWKSSLDLGAAEGRFAVAKAILGFSNRSVAQAELALEGAAYMVIGVEPGTATGVSTFDHATLGQRIKTYADGPRWTPHYVEFSGVEVLVIVVESPRAGDQIHSLQKAFSNGKTGHQAGTVFVRGAAHTEPAGPKEIQMLGERLLHGVRQPDLDLALVFAAEPLTRLNTGADQVQEWLTRHERYVRANSGAPPPPPPRQRREPQTPFEHFVQMSDLSSSIGSTLIGGMSLFKSEDAQEFDRRVEGYRATLGNGLLLGHVVRSIVLSENNKVYFSAGNMTDDPVSGVQLTVVVPKSGLRVYTDPPSLDVLPSLPKWPDQFRDRATSMAASVQSPLYDFDPTTGSVIETTDAFEVTWDIGNLRPEEWSRTLEITVVAGPGAPDEVEVEMIARAMDRRRTATETATIAVGAEQWTVDNWYVADPAEEQPNVDAG